MSLLSFSIASTIGKIPGLLIEVYSAYHVINEQMKRKKLQSQVVLDCFICGKNGEKKEEGAYAPSLFFSPFFPQIK